jgi:hypothetical protein
MKTLSNREEPPAVMSEGDAPELADADTTPSGGITPRVVVLCLALTVFFGCIVPLVDVKMFNTFVGAQHMWSLIPCCVCCRGVRARC